MNTISALNSLDDLDLLKRIGEQQDKLALAELYDRYRHSLGSFIRRRVYQDKLVDEIYNDVMLTVWQKAASFRGDSKASTWIFGIAHRICMSHLRKEIKHTQHMTEVELDDIPAQVDEPNRNAEQIEKLRSATSKLKENHRVVIELTYFHGHSLIEIADIIGCPINTVKTRLFHARNKLRHSLTRQSLAS